MHQEIFEPLMLQGLFRFGVKLFNITLLQVWLYWKVSGNRVGGMYKNQNRHGQVPSPTLASCLYKQIGPGWLLSGGERGNGMTRGSWWGAEWKGIRLKVPFDWNRASHLLRKAGWAWTGFINRWSHQETKPYTENRIVPGTRGPDFHGPGKARAISFTTRLNTDAEGSFIRRWMVASIQGTGHQRALFLLPTAAPNLPSQSPWWEWWGSNHSWPFPDAPPHALWALCYVFTSSKPHSNPLRWILHCDSPHFPMWKLDLGADEQLDQCHIHLGWEP